MQYTNKQTNRKTTKESEKLLCRMECIFWKIYRNKKYKAMVTQAVEFLWQTTNKKIINTEIHLKASQLPASRFFLVTESNLALHRHRNQFCMIFLFYIFHDLNQLMISSYLCISKKIPVAKIHPSYHGLCVITFFWNVFLICHFNLSFV